MNAKKGLLLLSIALIFLLTINFVSAIPIPIFNTTNLIPVGNVYPTNSTAVWGVVAFNFSTSHGPGTGNVTNATFYINSSTGAITNIGTNTTQNLTNYSVRYDTTAVADGNYTLIINVSNFSGPANPSIINGTYFGVGTFQIDNTPPTLTITAIRNQTNVTGYGDSVGRLINVTITPSVGGASIQNCTFAVNGTQVNGSIVGLTLNGTFSVWNWTVVQLNLSHGFYQGNLTCDEDAKDIILRRGPTATLQSNQFIVDLEAPSLNIVFKDSNGDALTEFFFGDPVAIDCNPGDRGTGIVSSTLNLSVRRPGIGTFQNITGINRNVPQSELGDTTFTETLELGEYLVQCIIEDQFGFMNATYKNVTNKTFNIITKATARSSAAAIPGFEAPVGRTKVQSGVTSEVGALPLEGVSRLLAKGSTLVVTIKNEDHRVTVLDVTKEDLSLRITSAPMEVSVKKGESASVDLDNDGTDDLKVTFHKLFANKWADVTLEAVATPSAPPTSGTQPGPGTQPTKPEEELRPTKAPLVVTLIVIVAILVIGYLLIKGKKK